MEAPLYVTTFAFVMNKDKYNQMSDKQKKAIDDNCNTEAAGRVGEPWGKYGGCRHRQDQGAAQPRGLQADAGADRRCGRRPPSRWSRPGREGVKKAGGDPDAAMTELRAALTKHNALAQ